jgi:hypothetical protein
MPADTFLIIALAALGIAAIPLAGWLRAQKRIRDLEMTLLAETTGTDRYEELFLLLQQVAAQTEQLADHQVSPGAPAESADRRAPGRPPGTATARNAPLRWLVEPYRTRRRFRTAGHSRTPPPLQDGLMSRSLALRLALCTLLTIWVSAAAIAQTPTPDAADVGTIKGIVHAYYDVINGPPGAPRQWRRDSTLYMPGAMFVSMDERDGKPRPTRMTPEEYRRSVDADFVAKGFFETEIGSRIERFGNVAQVRSVYETRRLAAGPLLGRGVNYLMLYWDGTRWWITGAVWDDERGSSRLADSWIGRFEEVP